MSHNHVRGSYLGHSLPWELGQIFGERSKLSSSFLAILNKEKRTPSFSHLPRRLNEFINQEVEQLKTSDPRFKHFWDLKDVTAHDLDLEPDIAYHAVGVEDKMQPRDSVKRELMGSSEDDSEAFWERDVPQVNDAVNPPRNAKAVAGEHRSALYHRKDWPCEDMATYCREIAKTLEALINNVYQKYT